MVFPASITAPQPRRETMVRESYVEQCLSRGSPGRKKGYFQFKTLDQAERCYQRVAGRKEKASDAHKKGR